MFSCEFCENSKNTFLHRTPLVAASDEWKYRNRNITNNVDNDIDKKYFEHY